MKNQILNLFTAVMIFAIFYGCSKENSNLNKHGSVIEEPNVSMLVQNFMQRMHEYKTGITLKSEESIRIDSAIWYIDAALNLTYANGSHSFACLHWDTVFIHMDVLNSYEAMYQQVFEGYDASLDGLAERYHAIIGENKQFMMAIVEDMGALPGNKHNLRIITVTGTGTLEHNGEFEPWESYWWHKPMLINCEGNPAETNAPLLFEALLKNHFDHPPTIPNCRWYYYGPRVEITYWYYNYPSGLYFQPNYMNYKVFFASSKVGTINAETKCLEYDQYGLGLHEMQYYYDNLKDFVEEYHNSPQNTDNLRFAAALIESDEDYDASTSYHVIQHIPQIIYRKRMLECTEPFIIPER